MVRKHERFLYKPVQGFIILPLCKIKVEDFSTDSDVLDRAVGTSLPAYIRIVVDIYSVPA